LKNKSKESESQSEFLYRIFANSLQDKELAHFYHIIY